MIISSNSCMICRLCSISVSFTKRVNPLISEINMRPLLSIVGVIKLAKKKIADLYTNSYPFQVQKNLAESSSILSLHSQKRDCFVTLAREFSSAGSEHLPYKQRVGGSNPSTPTQYW